MSDAFVTLYPVGVPTSRTLTINGVTYDLSADRSWTVGGGGGLTNWTESYSSATQSTSQFIATNAATNVNAAFVPKGNGGIIAAIPDATATGGNSRGQYTVDLQRVRSSATMVANGNYGVMTGGQDNQLGGGTHCFIGGGFSNYGFNNYFVICGGYDNTNGGTAGFVGGGQSNNLTSGSYAVLVGGDTNYVNGNYAFLGGGYQNQLNEQFTSAVGGRQANATLYGMQVYSAGQFTALADAQMATIQMRRAITGTAITELFLDGSSVRAVLPTTNSIWMARVQIVAVCTAAGNGTTVPGDVYVTERHAGIKRLNTTTSLVGSVQTIGTAQSDASMSTSVVTITADDSNEALKVEFTPPSTAGTTTTFRVVATIQLTQVKY